jgi:hypothetical protein
MRLPPGPSAAGGCRLCPVRCERLVYPAGCLERHCPRLYSYERDGRVLFGCLEKVFAVEIDRERFDELQARRGGFGGLRVARDPLPVCPVDVERTFEHRRHGSCVNPDFLLSSSRSGYTVALHPRPQAA